jgi:hypothetical protein
MFNVVKLGVYTPQDFIRDFIDFARSPAPWEVLHEESSCLIKESSAFEIGPAWAGVAETIIGDKVIMKEPMFCTRSDTGKFVVVHPEINEIVCNYIARWW